MQNKQLLRTGLWTLMYTMSAMACARLFLRYLSVFLSFEPEFSAIFAQIRDAKMGMPILWFVAVAALFIWLCRLSKTPKRKGLAVFCAVLLWLLSFVVGVLLTRVNGIRFCDVLFSLLHVAAKGGLG